MNPAKTPPRVPLRQSAPVILVHDPSQYGRTSPGVSPQAVRSPTPPGVKKWAKKGQKKGPLKKKGGGQKKMLKQSKSLSAGVIPPPIPSRMAQPALASAPPVPSRPQYPNPGVRQKMKFPSFGVSLESIMQNQKLVFPADAVPHVYLILVRLVKENHGMNSEGIFRLSGNKEEVQRLKDTLNKGVFDVVFKGDPNNPACALKQFVGELKPPLIPPNVADSILAPIRQGGFNKEQLLEGLRVLPQYNVVFLKTLLAFLGEVLQYPDNRMTPSSLAIVFSPNIFVVIAGDNPFAFMSQTGEQTSWLECLLRQ
jgi:hypothetical protein